jgi:hypothetical protein
MRKHVGLADVTDEQESYRHLQRASRYALVYLAESKATDVGIKLRELYADNDDYPAEVSDD